MTSYNSTREEMDVKILEALGFKVINPNQEKHQKGCIEYGEKNGSDKVMEYFRNLVDDCDIVAFRSIPDGRLLSGVAYEVNHAIESKKIIIELPSTLKSRMMTYPETKEYLIDLGHYKI